MGGGYIYLKSHKNRHKCDPIPVCQATLSLPTYTSQPSCIALNQWLIVALQRLLLCSGHIGLCKIKMNSTNDMLCRLFCFIYHIFIVGWYKEDCVPCCDVNKTSWFLERLQCDDPLPLVQKPSYSATPLYFIRTIKKPGRQAVALQSR